MTIADASAPNQDGAVPPKGAASKGGASPRRIPWWGFLLALANLILCAFSAVAGYAGVPVAVAVLVGAFLLRRRGFRVTGIATIGLLSLLIAAGSTYACYAFLPGDVELAGQASEDHAADEGAFDSAFEAASAPPGAVTQGE